MKEKWKIAEFNWIPNVRLLIKYFEPNSKRGKGIILWNNSGCYIYEDKVMKLGKSK